VTPFSGNLFALLTLIVAPAVLTNATSVLALNTANRFGRVIDRSRQIVGEMQHQSDDAALDAIRLRQMGRLRLRARFLLHAQTCLYSALGLFVATALVSVVGAALASGPPGSYRAAAVASLLVGTSAAGCLLYACVLLVRETRLAITSLAEETELLEARARRDGGAASALR
jgi:hypothetical protein